MPAKAKRYTVKFKDPLLGTWRVLAPSLSKVDADKLIGMIQFDAVKVEVDD